MCTVRAAIIKALEITASRALCCTYLDMCHLRNLGPGTQHMTSIYFEKKNRKSGPKHDQMLSQ